MKKEISIFLLLFALLACNQSKTLVPERYVQFLENAENKFVSKQVFGFKEYSIQLANPEYMVCKEVENIDSVSLLTKRIKELKGHIFFLIKIGTTEKSRKEQGGNRVSEQQLNVNDMVAYYDQQAIVDIKLLFGTKELSPVTYVFENNYDLSPYNTIVVGFEIGEQYENMKLNFNDRYTNTPAIRASFSKEQMTTLPKLKI
ncbi:MAG: hypothetical protein QM530_08220 [Phycisphaerales bacterium]|nr:hypothetical protein [Phycisphaerales bacterium]